MTRGDLSSPCLLSKRFGYDRIIAGLSTVALDRFAALVAVERSFPSNTEVVYKRLHALILHSSEQMCTHMLPHLPVFPTKSDVLFNRF